MTLHLYIFVKPRAGIRFEAQVEDKDTGNKWTGALFDDGKTFWPHDTPSKVVEILENLFSKSESLESFEWPIPNTK